MGLDNLKNLNYEIHWKVFDDRINLLNKGIILSAKGFENLNPQEQDLIFETIYKGFETSDFAYKNLLTGEEQSLENLGHTIQIFLNKSNPTAYTKSEISEIAKRVKKREREETMVDGGLGRTFF